MKKTDLSLIALFVLGSLPASRVLADPPAVSAGATTGAASATPGKVLPEEMEVQIKGQFKGRLLVKKISAPVTMNLEKLQDFPEDPSQKILIDPLPVNQTADFNSRNEVKGHAPFFPWIPPVPEPPFLAMTPPKNPQIVSWMFEVLNPEGRTIFRQRSTHALPDELIWEGKDSEMQFAVVDRLYAAQLTLMTPDEKVTVIPGPSIVLPMMAYSSEKSQTVEMSLSRLFVKGSAQISPEGVLMVSKLCEMMRERSLNKVHIRLAEKDTNLATQQEIALVEAVQKSLHIPLQQIEHDHLLGEGQRGEIASFWLKL